ncbi:MAG: hypothetical protein K9M97_09565 [Akkermansiaceae bacterium]|nr:hypothetical protein [Akkermansiaceae bacterium]
MDARGLDRSDRRWHCPAVEVKTVSFERLQRDKRKARLRDVRRLARGEVTPEQLQDENSLVPMNATISIIDLRETLERYYGK